MRFAGLSSLLSRVLDSWGSGLLKNVLAGAGLTFGSTVVMTSLVNSYVARIRSDINLIPDTVLSFISMSQMDYAFSVSLSALLSRAAMTSAGIFVKKN